MRTHQNQYEALDGQSKRDSLSPSRTTDLAFARHQLNELPDLPRLKFNELAEITTNTSVSSIAL
jgi:hypothetical protein